jgi:hypothetical protein
MAISGRLVTDGRTFCKDDFRADQDCHFVSHGDAGVRLGVTEMVH